MVERQARFDEVAYLRHAVQLCQSHSYLDAAGRPTDFWPIGFPLALAAAVCISGGHPAAGVSLQITIGLFTCLLVSMLGERIFGRAPGRVAGLVMAFYPTHVFYSTLLLAEPLATLMLVAAAACLLRSLRGGWIAAIAGGLFLGYAILTRPVLMLLPGIIPFWYIHNGQAVRRAARHSSLIACGVLIVLGPWMIRNYRLFGGWAEISSTGGYNFLLGNSPGALGGYLRVPGINPQMRSDGAEDWSHGYRSGWETIRRQPAAAVARTIQKISYFLALETDGVLWNLKGLRSPVSIGATLALLALANLAYLALTCICLLALLIPAREHAFTSLLWLLAGYLLLMAAVFVGDPRYHFPLVPFAALVVSSTLLNDAPNMLAAVRGGQPAARRQLAAWSALMVLFGLLLVGNLWLKRLEVQRFGVAGERT